ncbi:GIY-YIG nuclease family protein [Flavobacterium sp. W20_MBD1_R3]|uniref:GIY-YIG nuclease family protein n=1 Tax=Flavobacterium sp. W20_MBD1_R3 TaxID=3240278 RepID=UPI003F9303D6
MYTVYIIQSEISFKYYIGQTDHLINRLYRHNSGFSLSTKSGKPWCLIYEVELPTRSEAMILEHKIKKRGAKRYLADLGFFK